MHTRIVFSQEGAGQDGILSHDGAVTIVGQDAILSHIGLNEQPAIYLTRREKQSRKQSH
jgi:hypothetical protein